MEKIKWSTQRVKIKDLKPAEYNPRQMTKKQAEDLSKSLERFSLADPIVINKNNTIIGGHQRINILKAKYGDDYIVDVRVPNRLLSKQEEVELNLRLNKNLGEWDWDALVNFDENLLKEVGFENKELDKIFQLNARPDDDAVPEDAPSLVKEGEIWQLGNHRIMCGDATDKKDVIKLMNGKRADMVFTDPPYNIGFSYNKYQDKMKYDDYKQFCKRFFDLLDCDKIIITPGPRNLAIWYEIMNFKDTGWILENIKEDEIFFDAGLWLKDNTRSGASCFHLRACEPIIFYGKFNKKRNLDVFEYSRSIDSKLLSAQENIKPTKVPPGKPVALIVDLLTSFSEIGEIIKDVFLGNGTTLIACEKTNRICYGMEIDKHYCDVIIKRWQDYTGKKAVKL